MVCVERLYKICPNVQFLTPSPTNKVPHKVATIKVLHKVATTKVLHKATNNSNNQCMFSNLRKAEEEAAAEHTAVPVLQSSVVVVLKTAWICVFRGVVFGNVNALTIGLYMSTIDVYALTGVVCPKPNLILLCSLLCSNILFLFPISSP
ncbi:CIC11C00000002604 [Sungouiella intermedia]|uniref:CIC11C00000002604 n=1 Tax=Sungouiella intermedia TaxID=45354 RepID=A0A1L0C456_9ASCO|nr:CIC11C00000002604 [[Candida] intermedia]